jgi:hypothetical protein
MKRKSFYVTMLVLLFIALLVISQTNAITAEKPGAKVFPKPTTSGDFTKVDINNISAFVRNNGSFNRDPGTGNSGFEWPKGSGNTAIYASGLWMGGIDAATNDVCVAVAEYSYEYQAGPIGVGINPDDARWRMYKISRTDKPGENPDWANWPFDDGAPALKNAAGTADSLDASGNRIPGLIGDQTVWAVFNDNDPGAHVNMTAPVLGVEVQLTAFAYNRSDALGNAIFYKWKLINKGSKNLHDVYVSVWADPDLGTATDDLDGCDTTLGLGYIYNGGAVDGVYGTAVPAAGFDFLQGPIIPSEGDTAYVSGLRVPGYKNLKMTSYLKYSNDASDLGNPSTGQECYNYFRSYTRTGAKVTDQNGHPADFMFPGDPNQPASSTNWLDTSPSDRRFMMSSGPFNMAIGDTQEIVAGNFIALGADFLGSVTALKQADEVVQTAYDLNFKLAAPPIAPTVAATPLDKTLLLDWAEDYKAADEIEATSTYDPLANAAGDISPNYNFEGYVVYQYSHISGSNEKMIATYDIKDNVMVVYDNVFDPSLGAFVNRPVKNGSDNGIRRSFKVTKDYYTNAPLVNDKDYYFAVSSYTYNAESVPKTLESAKNIFAIRPRMAPSGTKYNSAYGDTVHGLRHTAGVGNGSAFAKVIDPSKVTGHYYEVHFKDIGGGSYSWMVVDTTKNPNDTLAVDVMNQSGDDAYPTVDGIMVKVMGPQPGMKSWSITGTRRFSPVNGFYGLGLEGFSTSTDPTAYDVDNGTIGMAGHFAFGGVGTTLITTQYHHVLLKLAAVDPEILWDPLVAPADTNYSRSYRWLRSSSATPPDPSFIPWIKHTGSGYQYQAFDYGVPFSAWDMETDPPTRLAVGHFENNVTNGLVDGRYWPRDASDAIDNTVAREFCFIFNEPYSTTPNPAFEVNLSNNHSLPMMWVMVCARRNANPWAAGDEFLITANKINTSTDVYGYSSSGLNPTVNNLTLQKTQVERIMAVPNPYFGTNDYEQNQFNRIIRFTNLPNECKIRIFNLQGSLVRTLDKSNSSTTIDWDLLNFNELPVASGMYIVYIDMPGVGTKVLKVAVIMAQERLDNF